MAGSAIFGLMDGLNEWQTSSYLHSSLVPNTSSQQSCKLSKGWRKTPKESFDVDSSAFVHKVKSMFGLHFRSFSQFVGAVLGSGVTRATNGCDVGVFEGLLLGLEEGETAGMAVGLREGLRVGLLLGC